jgi:hypothetical protein
MSTKDREKSRGKARPRSGKPEQRRQKPDQKHRPKPDQQDEDQIGAMVASTEIASTEVASTEVASTEVASTEVASADGPTHAVAPPSELPSSGASTPWIAEAAPTDAPLIGGVEATAPSSIGEVEATDAPSIGAGAPADNHPVSIQTIANAYGTYTEKSFRETSAFVEKLMGVRSFDQVIEVQTEFAKQACATFASESQKIRELYTELAKETLRSWQGFAAKVTQVGR